MTNLSRSRFIALAALACGAAACALGAGGALAAGMYKWTDDKGIVHYSDQMPPDAVNKGTTVFDKQGRPVKKIEAAPTPEQLKAKELEDERLKATSRQRDEQMRKDMALLQSYTSEDEIEFARARAISAVTNQIKAAEGYIADLTRRQQELEKQKAALNGKPVPAALENELIEPEQRARAAEGIDLPEKGRARQHQYPLRHRQASLAGHPQRPDTLERGAVSRRRSKAPRPPPAARQERGSASPSSALASGPGRSRRAAG